MKKSLYIFAIGNIIGGLILGASYAVLSGTDIPGYIIAPYPTIATLSVLWGFVLLFITKIF